MPTFRESGLEFTFPDDWEVLPFDKHPYYRTLSGHGLSGVDFMALLPDGTLLLLEVKNYTDPYPDRNLVELPKFVTDFDGYARRMARKATDSLRTVRIVEQMLLRKRGYRWLVNYPWWLQRLVPGWYWWYRAAHAAAAPARIWFVLWAENPESIGIYTVTDFAEWKQRLAVRVRSLLSDFIGRVDVCWLEFPPREDIRVVLSGFGKEPRSDTRA